MLHGLRYMMPERIQLRRTKGWRKPEGAIVVARPSKWGNPYKIGHPHPAHGWPMSRQEAVDIFAEVLRDCIEMPWERAHAIRFRIIAESIEELRGKDLACWCNLADPCHADVLLEVANR